MVWTQIDFALPLAINVSLAFCMGTDIEGLLDNPIGQPMATIFFNSFGQKGTLAVWAIVVIVQYVLLLSSIYSPCFLSSGCETQIYDGLLDAPCCLPAVFRLRS